VSQARCGNAWLFLLFVWIELLAIRVLRLGSRAIQTPGEAV
jgi:hypothetical protein